MAYTRVLADHSEDEVDTLDMSPESFNHGTYHLDAVLRVLELRRPRFTRIACLQQILCHTVPPCHAVLAMLSPTPRRFEPLLCQENAPHAPSVRGKPMQSSESSSVVQPGVVVGVRVWGGDTIRSWQRMASGKAWQYAGRFMPCMKYHVPHTMPQQSLAGLHLGTDTTPLQSHTPAPCL